MARRAAKVDGNQTELVAIFRQLGVSVEITSSAHDGFTDLVVGYNGVTVLAEIKDGSLNPSRRKLTPAQEIVHERFTGAITVVETVEQAIELVRRMREASARLSGISWYLGAVANATQEETKRGQHAGR